MIVNGNIEICSVGTFLPPEIVTTESMMSAARSEEIGISQTALATELGIKEVRRAAPSLLWSDLAARAAEDCLSRINIPREDIGMVIYTGIDGDHKEPSVAHKVQDKLGMDGMPAYDISNACQGFVTGLMAANAHIGNGDANYILVVTGELGSRLIDMVIDDIAKKLPTIDVFRSKMGVFSVGDAGGAVLVRAHSGSTVDPKFKAFNSTSRGKYAGLCEYRVGRNGLEGHMMMREISAATYKEHRRQFPVIMKRLGWQSSDVDALITHQVGSLGFKWLSKMSGVPMERMTKTYDLLGNLTTVTLAVNLRKCIDENLVKEGGRIVGLFSGSGITVVHFGLYYNQG